MILSLRGEPLALELDNFVNAVATGGRPLVTGEDGLAALELCEQVLAASQAMLTNA